MIGIGLLSDGWTGTVVTMDNLFRQGIISSNASPSVSSSWANETIDHSFVQCSFTKVWMRVIALWSVPGSQGFRPISKKRRDLKENVNTGNVMEHMERKK